MRKPITACVALAAALSLLAAGAAAQNAGGVKGGSALNMEVVGYNDLGGRGFNADLWVHEGYAYVGHWGFSDWSQGSKTRFCPSGEDSGVAVVDARDPTDPVVVSTLQNPPGTSAEDLAVFTARYGPFAGEDIAVVGLQVCGGSRNDPSFHRGIQLFKVTDPSTPVELGLLDIGCCARGVHELEVQHRDDLAKTFVYASVPFAEAADAQTTSGRRDEAARGDFRLFDVTDPQNPTETAHWSRVDTLGGSSDDGQGCFVASFGHSAEPSEDGKTAFVAWWDAGYIALDLSDPANPTFLGQTAYDADEDGDGHSSMYDEERQVLFTADEDFCPNSGPDIEKGWGYLRAYDYSDPAAPVQIGEYRTPNSMRTTDLAAGDYTIHMPMLMETDVYAAWYSDGVRVVDASDATNLQEVAFFVPPASNNPVKPSQRFVLSNTPQVWGVQVAETTAEQAGTGGRCVTGEEEGECLVYLSDMNSGLWILRRTD